MEVAGVDKDNRPTAQVFHNVLLLIAVLHGVQRKKN